MTSPISVLCLFLTAGSLRGLASEQAQYKREDGSFSNTVEVSLPAWSAASCAIRCTAMKPWFCGGFTYHDSGTCDLYRGREEGEEAICVNPLEAAPPLVVESGTEPRSYRRLQANKSTCPGGIKCNSMYTYDANVFAFNIVQEMLIKNYREDDLFVLVCKRRCKFYNHNQVLSV